MEPENKTRLTRIAILLLLSCLGCKDRVVLDDRQVYAAVLAGLREVAGQEIVAGAETYGDPFLDECLEAWRHVKAEDPSGSEVAKSESEGTVFRCDRLESLRERLLGLAAATVQDYLEKSAGEPRSMIDLMPAEQGRGFAARGEDATEQGESVSDSPMLRAQFSVIGYDRGRSQALVHLTLRESRGVTGTYYLLKRQGRDWTISSTVEAWVS